MQAGGYPLAKNDLTPDEWRALGAIERERQQRTLEMVLAGLGLRLSTTAG